MLENDRLARRGVSVSLLFKLLEKADMKINQSTWIGSRENSSLNSNNVIGSPSVIKHCLVSESLPSCVLVSVEYVGRHSGHFGIFSRHSTTEKCVFVFVWRMEGCDLLSGGVMISVGSSCATDNNGMSCSPLWTTWDKVNWCRVFPSPQCQCWSQSSTKSHINSSLTVLLLEQNKDILISEDMFYKGKVTAV